MSLNPFLKSLFWFWILIYKFQIVKLLFKQFNFLKWHSPHTNYSRKVQAI